MGSLTENAIERMLVDSDKVPRPVLQVLEIKKINNQDRYKLNVSDGMQMQTAMLATQLNQLIDSMQLVKLSVVCLENYIVNEVGGRKVLIILDLKVVRGESNVIGNPQNAKTGGMKPMASKPEPTVPAPTKAPIQNFRPQHSGPARQYGGAPAAQQLQPQGGQFRKPAHQPASSSTPPQRFSAGPGAAVAHASSLANERVIPIRALNPYQNKWVIKGRVTSKSDVRTWNKGGDNTGSLFNMVIVDADGTEIRATFFKDAVTKFYDYIQENKVYLLSNGQVKQANKNFSNLKIDWEITFGAEAKVEQVEDDPTIKQTVLSCIKIAELANTAPNSTVDVIGVAIEIGEPQEFTSKAGKELVKSEVVLVDDSNSQIKIAFWGAKAKDLYAKTLNLQNPVIALKNVKLGDFGGRSISVYNSSSVLVNPDLPEAKTIQQWFESGGAAQGVTNLSTGGSGGGGGVAGKYAQNISERFCIADIAALGLGQGDKPDYIEVKGNISQIYSQDKMWYFACPEEGNNKKVVESHDGQWICEATGQTYTTKENRYIANCRFIDHTGAQSITLFNDQAKQLFGKSADELEEMKNNNETAYDDLVKSVLFTEFTARLRVKEESYNNATRVKCTVASFQLIDPITESKMLLDAIRQYNQ